MKLMAKVGYICVGVSGVMALFYAGAGYLGMSMLGVLGAMFNWYVAELNTDNQNKGDKDAEGD